MNMKNDPKISIITASKNGARFLRETLDSILRQSFTDYEHIVVDCASTDNTLKILEEYKDKGYNVKWISEPDRHADEGFYKAAMLSRGEYIMLCCVSDGYLDKDWFKKCADTLDENQNVSLIYGIPQNIEENGTPRKIVFSHFSKTPPPQESDFFPFWLGTCFVYPESTFCVRSEVFRTCFPKFEESGCFLQNHALFGFNYNFNVNGYLPYFLPIIASFGRSHHDSNNIRLVGLNSLMRKQYFSAVARYRTEVLSGKQEHFFHNGRSDVIGQVESGNLANYRRKILDYRLNSRFYLGKRKKRSLGHQINKLKIIIDHYLGKN